MISASKTGSGSGGKRTAGGSLEVMWLLPEEEPASFWLPTANKVEIGWSAESAAEGATVSVAVPAIGRAALSGCKTAVMYCSDNLPRS